MRYKNIFESDGAHSLISRLEQLSPDAQPEWGQMNVAQMLAHCSKPFETVYDPAYAQKHPRPNALLRFIIKLVVKPIVVGDKPFKRNARTAPEFVIDDEREFATERERLINFIKQVHEEGAESFHQKENHSFGRLTSDEWSMLFYKHTDHHLTQFGV